MTKSKIRFFYFLTLLFMIGAWWLGANIIMENQPLSSGLKYYGNDLDKVEQYQVKKFSFTNQNNQTVTRENFENKIWVSEFFFATCDGICPIMNKNLKIVNDSFIHDTNVMFLSHTVDPETDNIQVLSDYAQRHSANPKKWHFVTGDKEKIYDLARTSYLSATARDTSFKEDFVHSQLLCLIDPHLHIRGYYDGTVDKDVQQLIKDIRLLEIEYEIIKRKKSWISRLIFD